MPPDALRSVVALRVQAYDAQLARGSVTLEPHAVGLLAELVRRLTASVSACPLVAGNAHRLAVA